MDSRFNVIIDFACLSIMQCHVYQMTATQTTARSTSWAWTRPRTQGRHPSLALSPQAGGSSSLRVQANLPPRSRGAMFQTLQVEIYILQRGAAGAPQHC
jgi:hypothetical protein